ncbi:MAG: hypothetical protein CML47_10600 [Rhodobacteraceae bacterium]|nr:MAG: hypothetical protein CML47_10600 [Paracoccaceae bacterium]|tara:strand:- start:1756 stop:2433 length:678 start_codon:yes stop_codon:yes gene_type:complete
MEKKDSTETLISDDSYEENVAVADGARLLKRPNLDTKYFKVIKDEAEASPTARPRRPSRINVKIEYKPEKESDATLLLDRPKSDRYGRLPINDEVEGLGHHPGDHHRQFGPVRRVGYAALDHGVEQMELKKDDSGNVIKKGFETVDGETLVALEDRPQTAEEEGRNSPTRLMHSEQLRDRLVRQRNEKAKKMIPFGGRRRRTRATRTMKRKRLLRKKKRKTKRRR